MGRSLLYPLPALLMLLNYTPASKWHNDEKLTVLCGRDRCPTSSVSLLGEFAFSLALSLYCSPDICACPILFASLRGLHCVIISESPFFYIYIYFHNLVCPTLLSFALFFSDFLFDFFLALWLHFGCCVVCSFSFS